MIKTALLAAGLGVAYPAPYVVRDSGVLMPAPKKFVVPQASFPLLMRPPVLGGTVVYNSDLNWSLNSLPAGVTHGGGANGTIWNSAGHLATGSAGRLTFDPNALTCLGIYLEEARTNAAINSQDFGASNWNFQGITKNTNVTTSPDGTSDADQAAGNATANSLHVFFSDPFTFNPNTANYTISSFFKAGTCTAVALTAAAGNAQFFFSSGYDLSTPALGTTLVVGATLYARNIESYPNSWRRAWISGILNSGSGTPDLQGDALDSSTLPADATGFGDYNSGANLSYYLWQMQAEVGAFPSSPIITTSAAVTRSADTATTTNATYIAQRAFRISGRTAVNIPASGTQVLWQVDDGTTSNTATVYRASTRHIHLKVVTSGTTVCDLDSGVTVADSTSFVCAIRLAAANFGISVNGSAAVTFTTSGSVPTITTGRFGTDTAGANYWNGTLARVQGATTMSDAQLQSQST